MLKNQLDEIKSEMDSQKKDSENTDKYAKLLGSLYDKGVIDEDGNVKVNFDD